VSKWLILKKDSLTSKNIFFFYKKSSSFNGFYRIDKYKSNEWDKENNIFLEGFEFSDRQKLLEIEEKENIAETDIKSVNEILKNAKKVSLSEKIKSVPKEELQDWLIENSYRIIKTAGSSSLAKQVKELKDIPKQDIASFTSKENILFYIITDFNRDTDSPRIQVLFADTSIYKNPCDFWQDIKTTGAIANERGVQLSGGKKPEKLIHRIVDMTTVEGDIVLDYHSGSGTTAGVAHKMKRQWITIEQIDNQIDLSLTGLNNVLKGDKTGISELVNWKGGGDFIYCEMMKYNENFVEEIRNAKDTKSLLKVWEEMTEKAFFKHNFEMQEFKKSIEEFKKLDLQKQKQVLFDILDKNQLYVNYSEIEDKKFKVEKKDKEINKEFYGE
jgi:adenine-specific DNA-methyltransferase